MKQSDWLRVVRQQHPVGQGGFHSAEIQYHDLTFSYVYDCGSSNRMPLKRELRSFTQSHSGKSLNILALSHLDADHVNGIDVLLQSVGARTVLLPYFHPNERILIGEYWAQQGGVNPELAGFYYDSSGWLRDHGVDQVVYVLPHRSDAEPLAPPNREPPPTPMEPFASNFGRSPTPEQLRTFDGLTEHDRVLQSGEALPVSAGARGRLNAYWQLVPFTHPEPEMMSSILQLRDRLNYTVRRHGSWPTWLDNAGRVALKRLYAEIRADRNLTSMILYSGPAFLPHRAIRSHREHHIWFPHSKLHRANHHTPDQSTKLGWIGTGDAKLSIRKRAAEMQNHFRDHLGQVGSFMLPHHGAGANFLPQLFDDSSLRPDFWIAAAGENSYGHPDPKLRKAMSRRGQFVRVSGYTGRQFSEECAIELS